MQVSQFKLSQKPLLPSWVSIAPVNMPLSLCLLEVYLIDAEFRACIKHIQPTGWPKFVAA